MPSAVQAGGVLGILAVNEQMRAMQPVPDESLSCDAFALRDLCFVVRENIIDTAAMNVDFIAE